MHSTHFPNPHTRRSAKTLVYVIVSIVVVAVAAAAWAAVRWTSPGDNARLVDLFSIEPRSFVVELTEKGELRAANSVDIESKVEGRSTIISIVEEGAAVKEGDLLVELSSDELDNKIAQQELQEATAATSLQTSRTDLEIQLDRNESDIRKGKLEVELKALELKKYTEGEWTQSLRDAQIAIDQAKISLERAKEKFEASGKLLEKGFITKTDFDNDSFENSKAIWDLEKAQKAKEVLENYTHVAKLRQLESDHEEAVKELERIEKNAKSEEERKLRNTEGEEKELELIQSQLAKLREQKANCRIMAPTQGFVIYNADDFGFSSDGSGQIKEGASVHERQIIMKLPDTSQMKVSLRIHEAKTNKIHVGQDAIVQIEGLPEQQFKGKVSKIAAVADTQNRWLNPDLKEYETEVTLDPTDAPLKPGVTAHTRILVTEVRDALAVPPQTIYTKGGKRFVFRTNGGDVEPIEVQLGPIGSEWVAIENGVDRGDRLLMAFTEEQTREIPDMPTDAMAMPPPAPGNGAASGSSGSGRGGGRPGGRGGSGRPRGSGR